MIALVAGDMNSGPVPFALRYQGVETRSVFTTDEAEDELAEAGAGPCVLLLDAGSLDAEAGSSTWRALLLRHPELPGVIVTHHCDERAASAVCTAPHRALLIDPFDASAVVTAVQRATSRRLGSSPLRRVGRGLREAS